MDFWIKMRGYWTTRFQAAEPLALPGKHRRGRSLLDGLCVGFIILKTDPSRAVRRMQRCRAPQVLRPCIILFLLPKILCSELFQTPRVGATIVTGSHMMMSESFITLYSTSSRLAFSSTLCSKPAFLLNSLTFPGCFMG